MSATGASVERSSPIGAILAGLRVLEIGHFIATPISSAIALDGP